MAVPGAEGWQCQGHRDGSGVAVPGARHSSSPAEGRGESSRAPQGSEPPEEAPRTQPRSTGGLWELEREGGTCWERDPEGGCGRNLQPCSAKQAASTTLGQLGTAPGTGSPWELGMGRRAAAKSFSSSIFFFLLFRQKTVVEQIFSGFFFFFSSLAWPNPNLLKILMEKDISLWLILFPSLQEGRGGQVEVSPPLFFYFLGGEDSAPRCPSTASATARDAGGMSCPCSHTHTQIKSGCCRATAARDCVADLGGSRGHSSSLERGNKN